MLRASQAVPREFRPRFLRSGLRRALGGETAEQKAAEEAEEADGEEEREAQPLRHVLAGLVGGASHLEAEDSVHPRCAGRTRDSRVVLVSHSLFPRFSRRFRLGSCSSGILVGSDFLDFRRVARRSSVRESICQDHRVNTTRRFYSISSVRVAVLARYAWYERSFVHLEKCEIATQQRRK